MTKTKSSKIKQEETESKQDSEVASIRMNINITKAFHKKIKQKALDEDTTITDIVVKALKAYLEK